MDFPHLLGLVFFVAVVGFAWSKIAPDSFSAMRDRVTSLVAKIRGK